jgi:hypothetical protein
MKALMQRIAVVAVSLLLLVIMFVAQKGDPTVPNHYDSKMSTKGRH